MLLAEVRYPDRPVEHCHVTMRMARDWVHDANVACLMHVVAAGHFYKAYCEKAAAVISGRNVVSELDSSCLYSYPSIVRAEPETRLIDWRIGAQS